MSTQTRYRATENLLPTLRRRERSARWLARKIGVSTSLMGFVVNNQRTLSFDKALRAAAVLDEPLDHLFVSTSVCKSNTEDDYGRSANLVAIPA